MHGSPTIVGRNKIEAFWADDFLASNPITVLSVTHALEGADMVLVHGNYEVVDRDRGVDRRVEPAALLLFRDRGGRAVPRRGLRIARGPRHTLRKLRTPVSACDC